MLLFTLFYVILSNPILIVVSVIYRDSAYIVRIQWNEYKWNATSFVTDGKIMKPNFAWYFTQSVWVKYHASQLCDNPAN